MVHSQKTGIKFYENLGKLFYSVAMVDGAVHIKELDKLKQLVEEDWLEVDTIEDNFKTDAAYQIISVFDWLLEYEKSSEQCFKVFVEFYKENTSLFTDKIKSLIMQTANAIASTYALKNKSELVLLAKLRLLFKE
tara:strand:+ start:412 stop:816 length:405 start_codon:yes stop_codon:yes gene_type:complete